jgi:hypothetical protein
MPENIKALIVILFLGSAFIFFFRSIAAKQGYIKDYRALTTHWYVVTIASVITGNYWLFLLFVAAYLWLTQPSGRAEKTWLTYIIIGLMMPPLVNAIPPAFGINKFGVMTWYRFLIIVLLLPYLFRLKARSNFKWLDHYSDKLVVLFFLLIIILNATRSPSVSDTLRLTIFRIIDVIPYYAMSRGIKDTEDVKRLLFSCCVIIGIASLIAVFEVVKSWHVYDSISQHLISPLNDNITAYKYRSGLLRASVNYGSIPLGYIAALGFFMFYFFYPKGGSFKVKAWFMLIGLGMLAALSRGPWVGFIGGFFVLSFLKKKVTKLLVFSLVASMVIIVSPAGDKFISLLPGVGNDAEGTISYRQELFITSIDVMQDNLLFGDPLYKNNPKMQHLMQGEKIIDVVNSYIEVGLKYGLTTLGCFIGFLVFPALKLYQLSKSSRRTPDERNICYVLIAMAVTTIITIATVSGGGIMSFTLWVLVATNVAVIQMLSKSDQAYVYEKHFQSIQQKSKE